MEKIRHEGFTMNDCSHPLLLEDEDLLRYVLEDEPLSPEALEHVNQCSLCQERIFRYKQINVYLLKNIYRRTCPSATELNHYVARFLTHEETNVIDQHLVHCPLCQQEVQDIRQIIANFDPFPEQSFNEGGALERIIALPIPDTYQERSKSVAHMGEDTYWQAQYQVSDLLISLNFLQSVNGQNVLSAHLTFASFIASTCYLEGAAAELRTESNSSNAIHKDVYLLTQINGDGNLSFESVQEGIYTLLLHLPTSEVVIEDLLLKQIS